MVPDPVGQARAASTTAFAFDRWTHPHTTDTIPTTATKSPSPPMRPMLLPFQEHAGGASR